MNSEQKIKAEIERKIAGTEATLAQGFCYTGLIWAAVCPHQCSVHMYTIGGAACLAWASTLERLLAELENEGY